MAKKSAGILPYRRSNSGLQVLLVHPGGPFWQSRDLGAWSIAKGEYGDDEQPEAAARREFAEETGWELAAAPLLPLRDLRQRGGKLITAFAVEGDFDTATLRSNMFEMEWPPRSGRVQSFPEIDRGEWLDLAQAREKMLAGQRSFLDRLVASI
ncbi:NUDIX domain-containing protein [Mesorhizobium qingshengii]|uniref:NUDIX domain-containing protein n=1 Tax=Mesorhizobium qingshengii TaxID=1165689 RepID=A0ABT4QVJ3_9HYPH|nr:NUDIX domain-containing protein [Mesorhizobium qingshengii]MCZ8545428.1 NUDIX domain-containing protein [Mesorhizobium qingshengii]